MSSSSSHATVFTGVPHPNSSESQASHDVPTVITTRDRLRKDSEKSDDLFPTTFFADALQSCPLERHTARLLLNRNSA